MRVPTAAGLLVGILAVSFYNCLIESLEVFDAEMANASLDVVSYSNTQLGTASRLTPVSKQHLWVCCLVA